VYVDYMVFLVPYDGSRVSEAALSRAVEHGKAMDEEILAVSIIPTGADYAERRKWINPDENFAAESASNTLRRKIEEATDDAERNYEQPGAQSPEDGLSQRIREVAVEINASTLFVGASPDHSEEDLETPFGRVAPDAEYDIHIVRTA
jgi:nucleotide-binding universal stress UspA family protein